MASSGDLSRTGKLLLCPCDVTGMGRSRGGVRGKPVVLREAAEMGEKEATQTR